MRFCFCICVHICESVCHIPVGHQGSRKVALDALELELRGAVNCLRWVLGMKLGYPE